MDEFKIRYSSDCEDDVTEDIREDTDRCELQANQGNIDFGGNLYIEDEDEVRDIADTISGGA